MAELLAVATLPKLSGIPNDAVQNSFAFGTASAPATTAEQIQVTDAVIAFYNAIVFGGVGVSNWLAACLSRAVGACKVSLFDIFGHLDGTPHGSPIRVTTFTLGAGGTTDSMPDEVAACLSYHSNFGADLEEAGVTRPKARDRGRIYVGPLGLNAIQVDATTKEAVVTANVRATLNAAGTALIAAVPTWMVWSRKGAALKPVTGGWTDNAFDTQRRRGQKATIRETF